MEDTLGYCYGCQCREVTDTDTFQAQIDDGTWVSFCSQDCLDVYTSEREDWYFTSGKA